MRIFSIKSTAGQLQSWVSVEEAGEGGLRILMHAAGQPPG